MPMAVRIAKTGRAKRRVRRMWKRRWRGSRSATMPQGTLRCTAQMRLDPHSYNDTDQPEIANLDWRATIDFATRTLDGEATLGLRAPARAGGPLDLDTRDLTIHQVTVDGAEVVWTLAAAEPILGARLRIELPAGASSVTVA